MLLEKDLGVKIFDTDPKALARMKNQLYPGRYGRWDPKIKLMSEDDNKYYDLIIIGTPPETHLKIATKSLKILRLKFYILKNLFVHLT